MNKFLTKLDGYFEVEKRGSKFSTEIIAGITTFLAMAYILAVNPSQILGFNVIGTPQWNSVFIATAIGALIGTLLMALIAKLPFAQAPGMGLNAQTGLLLGGAFGVAYSFSGAMAIIFISGVIFLLLTILGLRQKIFDGIPKAIRAAIPVGIGLFIAFIGFQGAKIIQLNPYTIVQFVDFKQLWVAGAGQEAAFSALVGLVGLAIIAILEKFKVKGGILIGIFAATLLGIPLGVTPIENIKEGWNIIDRFAKFFSFDNNTGAFGMFAFGFGEIFKLENLMTTIVMILSFCMIDMFDTIGTLFGCASKANLLDENGDVVNFKKAMYADSIATVAGAAFGTSTVTTFVESGAGIAAGGKTGLSSVVTAALFLLAIFISPVFSIIPGAATAPALIYVGVLMMSTVTKIDFTDVRMAVPAFLTIVMMPLTYSITNGIGIGIISYVVINVACYIIDVIVYAVKGDKVSAPNAGEAITVKEKPKWSISIITLVIAALFLVMFLLPTKF